METTTANVHDLTPTADLLHGEATVAYGKAGYQWIEKQAEMAKAIGFRIAMRPEKSRTLPKIPGKPMDDRVEKAKAHARLKGEHSFWVIKQQ